MIELSDNRLVISFPEVHADARLEIEFQRTLRIPDDGRDYPLPPGLGRFPVRHIDDYAARLPQSWLTRGGVMLPMYQAEALWIRFTGRYVRDRRTTYPFAVKIATGKIDAVTGREWSNGLHRGPQDYVVIPGQPWLDGYCVENGIIRQFVAMPLGAGYSAEEQLTGAAEYGGLQLLACPMRSEVFERRFPVVRSDRSERLSMVRSVCCSAAVPMGLAPGGRMKQEIYDDEFNLSDWDQRHTSRCFVHIANSLVWESIAGRSPPHPPPTAAAYSRAGLPWFDYYDESAKAIDGSGILAKLKSVFTLGKEKGDVPLPENEPVTPEHIVTYRTGLQPGQVREEAW